MGTRALDADAGAARPFHESAYATHPSLVDRSHRLVEMFGITNVPFALWVDETGCIVRPAEVAFLPHEPRRGGNDQAQARSRSLERLPRDRRAIVDAMTRSSSSIDRSRYIAALLDWVAKGPASAYALPPEDVVRRSWPRPPDAALAAAHFEIGQHLHGAGQKLDAVPHFRAAHRLDPENWSYARQAYGLVDESMGSRYDSDLLAEVTRVGVHTF